MSDDGIASVRIDQRPSPSVQGDMAGPPSGVILHGTRSGKPLTIDQEYRATANYAANGGGGLAWHATGGEGALSVHLPADQWGWHAREASPTWLGYEFAQPTVDRPITDLQVEAFVAWLLRVVSVAWPALDLRALPLVGHSETAPGQRDGKSDPFPLGDPRMRDLRTRIRRRILVELDQPPAPTGWQIGPGLLRAITTAGEWPMSNEQYVTTPQGQYSVVHTDRAVWTYQADPDGRNERIYRAGVLWSPSP